ncbi:MAG: 2-succinyl-5-enolpyruvyl-6-hydroxy-3-cyclohexene-1-carboxylic-acid synthase [Flavobacteriales bacterium]|jgi:2-succinyl-5-enolpyruvyl-6-hydroxy-3-cyclohexene-1-carboxylate synthase
MTTTKHTAHWTLEALAQAGVKTIVFSPGSRNAPLIIAAEALGTFEMIVLGDERSAAFHALGRSQVTGTRVAVCCTSGSALANYYPAVLEAYYAHVPLIVLSADRPEDRINKGEGQTCVQQDFYEPHVAASIQIDQEDSYDQVQAALQYAIQAMHFEMRPIHFNVAFHEPLYERGEAPKSMRLELSEDHFAKHGLRESEASPDFSAFESVAVIAGQLLPTESEMVRMILDAGVNWTLFADPMSGLLDHPNTAPMEALLQVKPDAVLSIGGQWINKKPKQYLRSLGIKKHVHVDVFQCWDVLDANVEHIRFSPNLLQRWKSTTNFIQVPQNKRPEVALPWSDAAAFRGIVDRLDDVSVLHLGNSSVARYFNYFPKHVALFGNRGVAGIDGSLSTAVGAALAEPARHHTVILGDQSFLYDHNALYAQELPQNLTICILNNGIGGIFDWLPGTATTGAKARKIFANAQQVDLASLVKAFNVAYVGVENERELATALTSVKGLTVIDCKTEQSMNLSALNIMQEHGQA